MKDKLGLSGKGGPGQERRKEIYDELDAIRAEQGNISQTRKRIHEQLDALNEGIKKKVRFVVRRSL